MVFQDLALWPHMNVSENIAFGLKMHRVPQKEQVVKVRQMLEMVGLEGYETRHIDALSGGEQQRVALARALVLSPKTVLMDEPLSSLDPALNKRLRKEIVRLQKLFGFTLVYVTHSEEEAQEIGTRGITIENGTINQNR
jgi:ABC-type Fe3+/spermidine/putrescine transport system ATPase subunit